MHTISACLIIVNTNVRYLPLQARLHQCF